ncbi:MAG: 50S ribosomal protein L4 [Rickettsiales bacterium]|nr:50S ribosomal protein L4 [Rickettsiales bacterium]
MKVAVVDFNNKKIEEISLLPEIFGVNLRSDILNRVVEWQRSKARSGTHHTKTPSEVSGTTKKMYRQKGTGNARHGSARAIQFRKGGVSFGPRFRSHEYAMPKKIKKMALAIALSSRFKEKKLIVFKDLKLSSHKTKDLFKKFSEMKLSSGLIVGVNKDNDSNYIRASSNIKYINSLPVEGLNVLDILKHEYLCLTKESIEKINKRFV